VSSDQLPQPGADANSVSDSIEMVSAGHSLRHRDRISSREPAIHESISAFDMATMAAITTGSAKNFLDVIDRTGNTVCGRHPIGVIMAALENVTVSQPADKQGRFYFLRYERSSDVEDVDDSSVSYVSAFAVL
jgi:AmmeMemoRadiSam system protein B